MKIVPRIASGTIRSAAVLDLVDVERKAMIRRRFSTRPMPIERCPGDIGVVVHENRAQAGHHVHSASCWRHCGCTTAGARREEALDVSEHGNTGLDKEARAAGRPAEAYGAGGRKAEVVLRMPRGEDISEVTGPHWLPGHAASSYIRCRFVMTAALAVIRVIGIADYACGRIWLWAVSVAEPPASRHVPSLPT